MDGDGTERPDPEVAERARRRTFTAKYKLEVLAAADTATVARTAPCCAARAVFQQYRAVAPRPEMRALGALAGVSGRKRRDPQTERIARLEAEGSDADSKIGE